MFKKNAKGVVTAEGLVVTGRTGRMSAVLKPVNQKLSHSIAGAIARDIIDNEWQEGHFIGREPELLKHYKISRDTFREALRVLEWQGLARTTRGASGGLVVAKPSQDAIVNILRDYFDLTDITYDEVMEARVRLEKLTVRLATIRLTDEVIPRLQSLVAASKRPSDNLADDVEGQLRVIHEIGRVSGNTVLGLFIAPLDYVVIDFADLEQLSTKSLGTSRTRGIKVLEKLVAAIIANDEVNAVKQVDTYMALVDEVMVSQTSVRQKNKSIYPQWFDSGLNKSAQALIYRIKQDIDNLGLGIGDRLGSEVELIKKYEVSRSIFREASRILELIGVTQSRKGRDGGLIVSMADPRNTTEAAAQFLEQADLPFEQIYEARVALDTYAVELAAKRRTDIQLVELEEALQAESSAETVEEFLAAAAHMHSTICRACGNRVISLYIDILINSKAFRAARDSQFQKLMANKTLIVRSHQRILKAISKQDSKLASRQMRDHRAQLASYMQI